MKEINIARTIIQKRREKGITQDDLANFIGISKSSISKWETGQSYPDIEHLPQLAAYFNISLDELMGYKPQMINKDIDKLYEKLSYDFATKPFDEVMECCRGIVKKYFSCFPLIYRIGLLYTNYGITSKDESRKIATLAEAKELFLRVKEQSDDLQLKQIALHTEAICEMMLGNANEIIDLLSDVKPPPPHKVILSQAYHMTGKIKEAETELQESMYFSIVELFETIPPYLDLCANDRERFEETCKRTTALICTWNLKKLVPTTILPFYISAAHGYLLNENMEKSLEMLETYTDIVTSDIYPLKCVKADDFFNLIDYSTGKLTYGVLSLPRDEKSIKQSMADAIIENPMFNVLSNEPGFKRLVQLLLNNIEKKKK